MRRRRRVKQIHSLETRLANEAKELREQARCLPPGAKREALLRKARNDENTAYLAEWLCSPGVRSKLEHRND
ncbi:hypothetical protein XH93_32275 [Bradyrhizobium sp. CCBAU 51753]|nr:hypothetical protein [Bradyrhizobium sp. CCBAU 51753]MCC8937592.1 hypothetical protein [Bradyrhizobium ivorense]QOZ27769.1 hypothetical protein XH93_32275 [Bradyrhizobium sp. CCBAU 51753]